MANIPLSWRLIAISLLFLLLPLLAWLLVMLQDEQSLQKAVESNKQSVQLIKGLLQKSLENDDKLAGRFIKQTAAESFVVGVKNSAILIDGHADEWFSYSKQARKIRNFSQDAKLTLIEDEEYIYGVYQVEDDSIVYVTNDSNNYSDRIILSLGSDKWQFQPQAPGRINAISFKYGDARAITAVYAVWQETSKGYTLEFRVPKILIGNFIESEIHDVDKTTLSSKLTGIYTFTNFNKLPLSNQIEEELFLNTKLSANRINLLNQEGSAVFQAGSLFPEKHSNNFFNDIWLDKEDLKLADHYKNKSRLSNSLIDRALNGKSETEVSSNVSFFNIVRTAVPLYKDSKVIGVMIIENSDLSDKLISRNLWFGFMMIALFLWLLIIILLSYLNRKFSIRIKHLRENTEMAFSNDGALLNAIPEDSVHSDELSDLTNSLSFLTERLQEHDDYQKKLMSRLNHEIRTPVAIIRSSLDNVALSDLNEDEQNLIGSALTGVNRLSSIMNRLSEANRLEQSISRVEKKWFDLCAILKTLHQSYQLNWPKQKFILDIVDSSVEVRGSEELFAQLLDKIISNAVDFSLKESPILLRLNIEMGQLNLIVQNKGPSIEKTQLKKVFNLLYSNRKDSTQNLGLGLYLARLIATKHKAKISAHNLNDGSGVQIRLAWPDSYKIKIKR